MATALSYGSDDVVDMNVPDLQYDFTFETLQTPTAYNRGMLFVHHHDGEFGLEDESVGVYIGDVYYGSLFQVSDSDDDTEVFNLDWHQMNSITSDGTDTERLVNSPTVGDSGVGMTEYGTMSAVLIFNTVPEPITMLLFGFGLLGLAGVGRTQYGN
ncbi:MAG: PEP-CTERM sorting domain-containing protein [Thermodesulfobacteriota bacterium]